MNSPASQSADHGSPRADGQLEVVIVGAGFSGLGAACHLRKAGIRNFIVLEKASDIGGVWRDNNYPGLAVDVPVHLYSYEFEPWAGFTRSYASRDEIVAYQHHVANKYGLSAHLKFDCGVARATFDPATDFWALDLVDGSRIRTRFLVNATGFFTDVKFPDIPGLDRFAGALIHPARWDRSFDPEGKRVAIIGTGATAVQLIPALAKTVEQLVVYQRTPIWALPKGDRAFTQAEAAALSRRPRRLLRKRAIARLQSILNWDIGFLHYDRWPWLYDAAAKRLEKHLYESVPDPALRAKLLPSYTLFCKRPAVSDDYWPAFNRPNVELVTEAIAEITPEGVKTVSGATIPVDVLISATGYSLYDRWSPVTYEVIGLQNRSLGEFWLSQGFQAYQGISVPGFPNFFTFTGPYSITGVTFFDMIRAVSVHVVRCLRHARNSGFTRIEISQRAHAEDVARVRQAQKRTPILAGQCDGARSYYLDARGDAPIIRPESALRQWWRARTFSLGDYHFANTVAARRSN